MNKKISSFFPDFGASLANYKGSEVVSRLGKNAIQETVCGVLLGKNIRSLTEGLTRRRIALCSAAVLDAYSKAASSIPNFENRIISLVGQEYNGGRLSKAESMFLLWMLGLTNKGVQNILRGDKNEALKEYAVSTKSALESAAQVATEKCGELSGEIKLGGKTLKLNWQNLSQIFTVIGAQTLAIRGSEKSMYGKLFEKLVMGTLLSILGFRNILPGQEESPSMLFWLSQREDKRESDATAILSKENGMRFDIGFIGPGNPEISLDKVSRFERQMEYGQNKLNMGVIILIDRLGEGSRTAKMAEKINGHVVQMSKPTWVRDVAQILHDDCGYTHPIVKMTDAKLVAYIKRESAKVDIAPFIQAVSDENDEENE